MCFLVHFSDTEKHSVKYRTLRESQKLEAIGHLAGGVAHDFRNMLTVIENSLGPVGDAAAAYPAAKLDKHVERIRNASNQATRVVGSLLAFGGRREPDFRVTLLSDILLAAATNQRGNQPGTA